MSTNYRTRDDASPNNNTCTGAPGETKAKAASPERPGPFGMTDGYLAHDEIGRRQKGENLNYHDVVKGSGKLSMPKPEPKEGYKVHTVSVKHGSSADGHVKDGGDAFGYLGHFRSGENIKKGHNVGAPGDPSDMAKAASGAASGAMGAAGDVANTLTGGLFGGSKKQVMRPGIEARPTAKQFSNPKFAESHPVAMAQRELRQTKKGLGAATGPGAVSAAKDTVNALKGERKQAFGDIKSARQSLREAKRGAGVRAKGGSTAGTASEDVGTARAALKAAKSSAKTRFKGAYQAKFGPKQYA